MNVTTDARVGSGGICGLHGVYDGLRCPKCAENRARAALRQAIWEAEPWMDYDEMEGFFDEVWREMVSDHGEGDDV